MSLTSEAVLIVFGVDLRRLRYFLTVAEEGQISRAAARLYVAQPGLSQQLRVFERELGATLLDRANPRRLELTPAGQVLAEDGPALLAHADSLAQRVAQTAAGHVGQLRVSLSRSASHGLPVTLLEAFRAQHPQVQLTVTSSYTSLHLQQLHEHTLDIGFTRPPLNPPAGIATTTLGSEPFLIALPRGHPLARRRRRVSADELAEEPLVWWPREQAPGIWQHLLEQVYGPDTEPPIASWEPDEERMLTAVATGIGLTFISQSRAHTLHPPGMVYRRFTTPEPTGDIGLAWRNNDPNPALAAFLHTAHHTPLET